MIKALIAEDLEEERRRLSEYMRRYAKDAAVDLTCISYADGCDLLESYLPGADLVLLDIDMQHMDGITTARRIRQMDEHVQIVFITRMVQHALEGYEVQAADYIIKPVPYELFRAKMDRVFRRIRMDEPHTVRVKGITGQFILDAGKIMYAETVGKHIRIVMDPSEKGTDEIETALPLYQLEHQLPEDQFFRCHSAFLINLRYVTGYGASDVFLGKRAVPLSRHRKKSFLDALTAFHARRS